MALFDANEEKVAVGTPVAEAPDFALDKLNESHQNDPLCLCVGKGIRRCACASLGSVHRFIASLVHFIIIPVEALRRASHMEIEVLKPLQSMHIHPLIIHIHAEMYGCDQMFTGCITVHQCRAIH